MTTPTNPMDLPPGLTCGDCAHFARKCSWFISSLTGQETRCDWSPSRFRMKPVAGGAPDGDAFEPQWPGETPEIRKAWNGLLRMLFDSGMSYPSVRKMLNQAFEPEKVAAITGDPDLIKAIYPEGA